MKGCAQNIFSDRNADAMKDADAPLTAAVSKIPGPASAAGPGTLYLDLAGCPDAERGTPTEPREETSIRAPAAGRGSLTQGRKEAKTPGRAAV